MHPTARDRLIVALDMPTEAEARRLVGRLGDEVTFYKVGLELLFAGGLNLAQDLKRAGKPHELVEYEKESHQIDHEQNRIDMLRRIEAFLATHLGAGPVPVAAPAPGSG